MTITETNRQVDNTLAITLAHRSRELLGLEPMSFDREVLWLGVDILDAMVHEGSRAGLRATSFRAPLEAVFPSLSEKRPLLTVDEHGQPYFLLQSSGGRLCIEGSRGEREWVTSKELAKRLGLSTLGVEHRWVSLDDCEAQKIPLSPSASPWKNAFELFHGEGNNVGAIVLYALGVGLFSLVLPLTVQAVVNTVAFGQLIQPLVVLSFFLAAGLILTAGLRAMQAWVVEVFQRRLFVRIVSQLAERLPRVRISTFEQGHGPELANRFFDVFIAQKAISALLLGGIESFLIVVVGLSVLALYHPALLGFGILLLFAFVAIVLLSLGRGATQTTIAESKSKYAVAAWLEELIRHRFLLKSSGGRSFAQERLDQLASNWLQSRASHYKIYYRQLLGGLALQAIAHTALLSIGGWLVMSRTLTLGQLVAAELIVTGVVGSLSKLVGKLDSIYDLVAAADKLSALLGLPIEGSQGVEGVGESRGPIAVELSGVSTEGGDIRRLSLALKKGSLFAVRAERRQGRALSDLLFGFRLPDRGVVSINGRDIRDIDLDALRSFVAVVREPEILPGTIADNLRAMANHSVATSRLWSVLGEVGLSHTIRALPQGIHTILSPSAAPLDRIDALKLTVARVLVGEPGVVILDGVLECLPQKEHRPWLERIKKKQTVLVLTCEQAVSALCDTQIDLGEGRQGALT